MKQQGREEGKMSESEHSRANEANSKRKSCTKKEMEMKSMRLKFD
jgi:hypothetical protein